MSGLFTGQFDGKALDSSLGQGEIKVVNTRMPDAIGQKQYQSQKEKEEHLKTFACTIR